jgi:hypothetical protein
LPQVGGVVEVGVERLVVRGVATAIAATALAVDDAPGAGFGFEDGDRRFAVGARWFGFSGEEAGVAPLQGAALDGEELGGGFDDLALARGGARRRVPGRKPDGRRDDDRQRVPFSPIRRHPARHRKPPEPDTVGVRSVGVPNRKKHSAPGVDGAPPGTP